MGETDDMLEIAGRRFRSRLFLGTAGYPNQQLMLDSFAASGTEVATVSIRRVSLAGERESLTDVLAGKVEILPNTSGCTTVEDAVLTAQLAREATGTDWVKLELIGDEETLLPDPAGTVEAADRLVRDGFRVLPYAPPDPVTALRLEDVGCAAVMPLGSPIGSGRGIADPWAVETICSRAAVPVVLDAGIGTASDAAEAMELGCAAVLLNTAVSKARDPVRMAAAMRDAVAAGRAAARAGRIPELRHAEASSPQLGLIGS